MLKMVVVYILCICCLGNALHLLEQMQIGAADEQLLGTLLELEQGAGTKLFTWLRTYDAIEYMGVSQKDAAKILSRRL